MSQKVYVLHRDGTPLMPTRPAKARHLLEAGKAVVVRRDPFTIQLTELSGKRVQPVVVGVDMGAKKVGVAAVADGRVLYQGQVTLRDDISRRMNRRRTYRRSRRNRKCRYRAPRFNNRRCPRGWLPPSIQSKVDSTVNVVHPCPERSRRVGFVKGRRSSGQFKISDLEGKVIKPSKTYRKLRLVRRAGTLLTERRKVVGHNP